MEGVSKENALLMVLLVEKMTSTRRSGMVERAGESFCMALLRKEVRYVSRKKVGLKGWLGWLVLIRLLVVTVLTLVV